MTNDLKWDENTSILVKKGNKVLLLLRKACNYTNSIQDLRSIYLSHIRVVLEQSCTLWHNRITEENLNDLERVQKNACRIILGNKYDNYEKSLKLLSLDTLKERREKLSLKFGPNCAENPKTKKLFTLKEKRHKNHKQKSCCSRKENKFNVLKANTARLVNSTVPFLQRLLNKHANSTK